VNIGNSIDRFIRFEMERYITRLVTSSKSLVLVVKADHVTRRNGGSWHENQIIGCARFNYLWMLFVQFLISTGPLPEVNKKTFVIKNLNINRMQTTFTISCYFIWYIKLYFHHIIFTKWLWRILLRIINKFFCRYEVSSVAQCMWPITMWVNCGKCHKVRHG